MKNEARILANFDIDPVRGFLPADDPLASLPEVFSDLEDIAQNFSAYFLSGRLREAVQDISIGAEIESLTTAGEQQRAMLLLSMLASAFVWCCKEPAVKIPANISIPWQYVAEKTGRPMIVVHAAVVLNNWRRFDTDKPLSLENLDTLQTFLGGIDEKWFYLVTVMVEAAGAAALPALVEIRSAINTGDTAGMTQRLESVAAAVRNMQRMLERMPEHCDPHIFYHRVRPFLQGWPAPGIIYEGVSDSPQMLFGGSAAQSSLLQSIDAGLTITHHHPQTSDFLLEMRRYMPPNHRRFIETLENGPSVREFVSKKKTTHPTLAGAYNQCIQAIDAFRKKHIEITVQYILEQSPEKSSAKGTGGTTFMQFLSHAKRETKGKMIGF